MGKAFRFLIQNLKIKTISKTQRTGKIFEIYNTVKINKFSHKEPLEIDKTNPKEKC